MWLIALKEQTIFTGEERLNILSKVVYNEVLNQHCTASLSDINK